MQNIENWVVDVVRVTQGHEFLLAFHSNCVPLALFLRYSGILVENHRF